MKLHNRRAGVFTFLLGVREKPALLKLLEHFPLVPPRHFCESPDLDPPGLEQSRELLQEALAQQKRENREALRAMLLEPRRFAKAKSGFYLHLDTAQAERLLQVLNEVRVGSWVILGRPDRSRPEATPIDQEQLLYYWLMEMSGYFEAALLEALAGQGPPGNA